MVFYQCPKRLYQDEEFLLLLLNLDVTEVVYPFILPTAVKARDKKFICEITCRKVKGGQHGPCALFEQVTESV